MCREADRELRGRCCQEQRRWCQDLGVTGEGGSSPGCCAGDQVYADPPAPITSVAVAGLAPGAGNAVLQSILRVSSTGPWTPAASNSLEANMFLHLQYTQDPVLGPLQPYVYGVAVDVVQRGSGGSAPPPQARRLLGEQARAHACFKPCLGWRE